MTTTSPIQDIESAKTHEEALALATQAGKDFTALWFEQRDQDWDTVLHYVEFETGEKGSYPEIGAKDFYPDFSHPYREIHSAARENPLYPPTEEGDEKLQELQVAFEEASLQENSWEKEVEKLIPRIRQNLSLFLPILPDEETIPQARISGCDTESPQWETLKDWANTHVTQWCRSGSAEELLTELAENASYGGQPGLVVQLDGKDFTNWMKEKSLYEVLQGFGKTKASLAVYDFNNGSGHDIEALEIDWKKVTPATGSQPGIINNFIESVFGLVGNSSISIPGKGRGCWDNLWLSKNL